MKALSIVVLVAACAPSSEDVVGPFTGEVHRYVVDRFEFPANNTDARDLGDDLDGNGAVDNQIGQVIATLAGQSDVTSHVTEMIAAGTVTSTFEIQVDDLHDDDGVGVSYFGTDGSPATVAGGRFVSGSFASNRTRATRFPGQAEVVLPVLADADPFVFELYGMEIDLTPDGAGGYDGLVRGAIMHQDALEVAVRGLTQMIAMRPHSHRGMWSILNRDGDAEITRDEALSATVLISLLAPDLDLFDDGVFAPAPPLPSRGADLDTLSIGFRIHLSPCAEGRCAEARPPSCFDRVRNGSETDVDCGGGCEACEGTEMCAIAGDCRSGACDAGRCRAATCSDGVRDGLEADVDCGTTCATKCQLGKACLFGSDCASQKCSTSRICTL